jgi:hypothetical protein
VIFHQNSLNLSSSDTHIEAHKAFLSVLPESVLCNKGSSE